MPSQSERIDDAINSIADVMSRSDVGEYEALNGLYEFYEKNAKSLQELRHDSRIAGSLSAEVLGLVQAFEEEGEKVVKEIEALAEKYRPSNITAERADYMRDLAAA
ncbi:hypothetical protein [Gluconobacter wancherniae]|uniref:hypothetical protein n=1 Tax=Gluconobacter wancherniae TaxID=1307955 RepID=UPI001B8D9C5D|nr:hypothetical protein [Gluconobacter wancherniae]MBS1088176.1 hypothetical protein [Gluconobacter wancherniae]